MSTVAEHFAAIAEHIERGQADDGRPQLFAQTRTLCERAAAVTTSEETQRALSQVQQALETWTTVWPRLGSQSEFRLAVAREARLWAKRLAQASAP